MPRGLLVSVVLAGGLASGAAPAAERPAPPAPRWEGWSDAVFERARSENRFVLLDLEAVWCHWCHVMDETTYSDPTIVELIRSRFIPVRVDQDARPDLSNRYEDYGWPATIVFDGNGVEIVKFAGYIPPPRMAALLRAIIEDPTPGPSAASREPSRWADSAALSPELRKDLQETLVNRYDAEHGGWGFVHKLLDWDNVEYCLARARGGDAQAEAMARETLAKQRKLIDPVWGGVYQYSDSGDWDHPHFEKIMSMQAENLRLYAHAYAQWHEPEHLAAARSIHRFLTSFLMSPAGAFYTSQDADLVPGQHSAEYFAFSDAERRRRGIPRIDTHLYARENAWVVHALVTLYCATGEESYLDQALRAARWIVASRSLPGGGFRHEATDAEGPYLGDTLAAGRAFLSLYSATADRAWLARAEAAAAFIEGTFKRDGIAGFVTAASRSRFAPPRPQRDENIMAARFGNLLHLYTGQPSDRAMAEHALRYLATTEIAKRFETGGVLLAADELTSDPTHITIVGHKDDPAARALLVAALGHPFGYKRVELWDRRDGPLPHADVEYPELPRAAAFLCAEGRCSAPAFTAEELRARIERRRLAPKTAGLFDANDPSSRSGRKIPKQWRDQAEGGRADEHHDGGHGWRVPWTLCVGILGHRQCPGRERYRSRHHFPHWPSLWREGQ